MLPMRRTAVFLSLVSPLIVASCGEDSPLEPIDMPEDTTVVAASVTSATVADAGSPIFRTLSVNLDGPSAVVVDYWTENATRLRIRSDANASTHQLWVPRLRAASTYDFTVTAISSTGDTGAAFERSFQTDSLPPELAAIQFQIIGTATFPMVLLSPLRSVAPGLPFVVDTEGYIVWFRPDSGKASGGFTRLANGDFVFLIADARPGPLRRSLEVVTPMNEVVATLTEAEAGAQSGLDTLFRIHHDVIVTPDNTVLFLATDTGTVNDTVWTGEAIWEWDPATDVLTKRWTAKDFLTPTTDRGARTVPRDWLHANSLSTGPRGNILVSFFWTHEVISIAADYQSIEWRLGGPASTFVVADSAMEAGQHTAAEVSTNRVLLFDNGWDRSSGELFSRASELELDPVAGTARIAWEFRPQPDIYAPIVSSARRLENGNTVVWFGLAAGFLNPPSSGPQAVFEVTPTSKAIWRLVVVSSLTIMYRATPLFQIAGETEVTHWAAVLSGAASRGPNSPAARPAALKRRSGAALRTRPR